MKNPEYGDIDMYLSSPSGRIDIIHPFLENSLIS